MEANRLNSWLSRTDDCQLCRQKAALINSRYCRDCNTTYRTPPDSRHAIRDSFEAAQ